MADGNTLLNDKALQMQVILRQILNFMVFMRENYFIEIKALQPSNMPVVIAHREATANDLNSSEIRRRRGWLVTAQIKPVIFTLLRCTSA
jgi:hypothetical protein